MLLYYHFYERRTLQQYNELTKSCGTNYLRSFKSWWLFKFSLIKSNHVYHMQKINSEKLGCVTLKDV